MVVERLLTWAGLSRPVPRRIAYLLGEELELRCVPANFQWEPVEGHGNDWSHTWGGVIEGIQFTRSHWLKQNEQSGLYFRTEDIPGANDDVFFVGGAGNRKCIVDQAMQVHAMTLQPQYGAAIMVKDSLTISGAGNFSILSMQGAGSIVGFRDEAGAVTRGTLNLKSNSLFIWKTGGLGDITVKVEQSPPTAGTRGITVGDADSGAIWMRSATFEVAGELKWTNQDVSVLDPSPGQPKSRIEVLGGGSFWLAASNRTWGADASKLDVVNNGKVTLSTTTTIHANTVNNATVFVTNGTPTIIGSYTNAGTGAEAGKGLTDIISGTLKINGPFEQTKITSVTRLNNSTLEVTSPTNVGVVGLRNGQLQGKGTIIATELTMGYNPPDNPGVSGYPVVVPGDVNTIGTLTVNAYFRMYSGQLDTEISSEQDYDRIVVNGGVWLSNSYGGIIKGGSILGHLIGNHEQIPNPSQKFPVLTWTGDRWGDFLSVFPPIYGDPPAGYRSGYEDVNPKNFWFQKSSGGSGSGGGGGGGGGGSGSSPQMGEFTWDDKEIGDIADGKAAVKLVGASGNFLAPSADDWAGPAAFGGLGEGSYRVEYVAPSTTPQSAPAREQEDAEFATEWSDIVTADEDEEPYGIDAELALT